MRTYCYVAVCRRGGRLGGAKRFGAHRGRRGAGHIVAAARLQVVKVLLHRFALARFDYTRYWVSDVVNAVFTTTNRLRFDRRSTPIRLQFDRATTIRRSML